MEPEEMLILSRFVLFAVRKNYRYTCMLFLERRNARLKQRWGLN